MMTPLLEIVDQSDASLLARDDELVTPRCAPSAQSRHPHDGFDGHLFVWGSRS
jgi:hypothetical protein